MFSRAPLWLSTGLCGHDPYKITEQGLGAWPEARDPIKFIHLADIIMHSLNACHNRHVKFD